MKRCTFFLMLVACGRNAEAPVEPEAASALTNTCVARLSAFDTTACVSKCEKAAVYVGPERETCTEKCAETALKKKAWANSHCAVDEDGDGIDNTRDRCPGTAPTARVSNDGCPDRDRDGVPDNRDKCPDRGTPATIDTTGCVFKCQPEVKGQSCDDLGPVCRTKEECDRRKERRIPTQVPRDVLRELATTMTFAEPRPVVCPGDHRPPAVPELSAPPPGISAIEIGEIDATIAGGVAVSGDEIVLDFAWTAVTDDCGPVTYHVVVEDYHCHSVGDLTDVAFYHDNGWCHWEPVDDLMTSDTSLSVEYAMGERLYTNHLPFFSAMGIDPPMNGAFSQSYLPQWVRARVSAIDANGSESSSDHDGEHYFVLHRTAARPAELSRIPIAP